jgi:hypothetical protein
VVFCALPGLDDNCLFGKVFRLPAVFPATEDGCSETALSASAMALSELPEYSASSFCANSTSSGIESEALLSVGRGEEVSLSWGKDSCAEEYEDELFEFEAVCLPSFARASPRPLVALPKPLTSTPLIVPALLMPLPAPLKIAPQTDAQSIAHKQKRQQPEKIKRRSILSIDILHIIFCFPVTPKLTYQTILPYGQSYPLKNNNELQS